MGRDLFDLTPRSTWLGSRLDVFAAVDSTNLVADRLAQGGAPDGTVVLADRQTAGRGRLGRSFFSPGGRSLYLSIVLRGSLPPARLPEHVFAAAVAVAELAESRLERNARLEIKWPNDVLIGGRKLAGINLPAHLEGGRLVHAVLGIGVNVNTAADEFPDELREIATSLRLATGREHPRADLFEELLERLEPGIEALRRGDFAMVLERWRRFFRMKGAEVEVGGTGPTASRGSAAERDDRVVGTVLGVDETGALLLETARGHERILAGDVTLRRESAR